MFYIHYSRISPVGTQTNDGIDADDKDYNKISGVF